MTNKILAAGVLLALLMSPNVAWSAKMSRGECIDAVKQKLGSPYLHRSVIRAGVHRCLKYGPDAIVV
jgi:hypothetical protein